MHCCRALTVALAMHSCVKTYFKTFLKICSPKSGNGRSEIDTDCWHHTGRIHENKICAQLQIFPMLRVPKRYRVCMVFWCAGTYQPERLYWATRILSGPGINLTLSYFLHTYVVRWYTSPVYRTLYNIMDSWCNISIRPRLLLNGRIPHAQTLDSFLVNLKYFPRFRTTVVTKSKDSFPWWVVRFLK